jgi:hypothetical protein
MAAARPSRIVALLAGSATVQPHVKPLLPGLLQVPKSGE